jgi:hypothetical protein
MLLFVQASLSPPLRRALALDRAAAWRIALGGLVVVSVVARTWAAWARATPNYFPDEYLYAALARGGGSVRGQWASFPALLQPLLTAPLWHLGSVETSFRAVQAFDALAVSLAAIPVYILARRLGVSHGLSMLCGAFALALPDLLYSSWIVAEPVAYPLVLGAVAAIVVAVERPTARTQVLALALCVLAAFARIQFVVLPLAYLVAVLADGGPRAVTRHRWLVALFVLALAGVMVLGPAHVLGYYHGVLAAHVSAATSARSLGRNLLILAYAGGIAIVPGALIGLWRTPRAFGAATVSLMVLLLAQASLLGDVGIAQERYCFYVLPLFALAFAAGSRRSRWNAVLAVAIMTVAAAFPLSGYAAAAGKTHSAVLLGVYKLELVLGSPGEGALVVGAVAGALALLAAAAPRTLVLLAATAAALVLGGAAVAFDRENSAGVSRSFVDRSWVDDAHLGSVSILVGPSTSRTSVEEQLFWNRSVNRVLVFGGATEPDRFAVRGVVPSRTGTLGVSGPLLADGYGQTLRFVRADVVARFGTWRLVRGDTRLRLQATGRYADGWLAPEGRISVWGAKGRVTFFLTAPRGGGAVTLRFTWPHHALRVQLVPGRAQRVVLPVEAVPFVARYRASSYGFLGSRAVSVRATAPVFSR